MILLEPRAIELMYSHMPVLPKLPKIYRINEKKKFKTRVLFIFVGFCNYNLSKVHFLFVIRLSNYRIFIVKNITPFIL